MAGFGSVHQDMPYRPRTLHTKLQKMQLSSINTTIFLLSTATDFFSMFISGQRFHDNIFKKKIAVLCLLCEGLKGSSGRV